MIVIDQWNSTTRLYKIQIMVIYSHAILVAVTSECSVKRVICKTWTRTVENSADPEQTPPNAPPDQGLYYLFKLQEVNLTVFSLRSAQFYQSTLRDNRPTTAVSAFIAYNVVIPRRTSQIITMNIPITSGLPSPITSSEFFCHNSLDRSITNSRVSICIYHYYV